MGLLLSVGSISRYRVEGTLDGSPTDTVRQGLEKNTIKEIDNSPMEKAVGWTSVENPYRADYRGSSFVIGTHFVFAMRIDKKAVPTKTINKHYQLELARKAQAEKRDHFSRNEKKMIKDHVKNKLYLKIPSTPNTYDLMWDYENGALWFFSTLKSANEALEELFGKSFNLRLIRLFPFTIADLEMGLSASEKDRLSLISPSPFKE